MDQEKTETLKPVVSPPSLLATAAATAAKAAVTAAVVERDVEPKKAPKPKVFRTYTLRGRSAGRIVVRANR